MNARSQTACAVAGALGVALILVGFVAAHYIPPPKANWSAEHLQDFYRTHEDLKRFGITVMLAGLTLFAPLVAGMKVVLDQVEQPPRTLATLQVVIGTAGATLLILFGMLVGVAAFRPDRDPQITQAFHDAGWFMAFLSAVPFTLQALTIAAAVLGSPETLLPRWFGYLNLSVGVLLFPGAVLLMFKTGPLSYHGVLGYWIPLVVFASWMLAMAWAIRRSALATAAGAPAAAA